MFKNILGKIILSVALAVGLSACGELVEVPPASVGKVLTKHGFKEGTVEPSKFRLDFCIFYCDKLVTLNAADNAVVERMELFMPKDRLVMVFDLQATMSVKPSSYNALFGNIAPITQGARTYIPLDKIYSTYAEQIIRAEAREFLSNYSIEEIASNLEAVNQRLTDRLSASINEKTPFSVRFVGLSNLKYPEIIVKSQENAAERSEMIRQENAQLELSKVTLERELQEARIKRTIDVEKARAEAEVNKIIGDSITDKYVKYQELQALREFAQSQNKVLIPSKMLDSIAAQNMIAR